MTTLPQSTQILVIGGGPAGATAATLLAKEGFEVTLLEREVGPRYHIGESLLPAALEVFDLLGIREKIENYGFQRKSGAYFEWGPLKWSFDFEKMLNSYSYQVARADFDKILLDNAIAQGVKVFEGIEVRQIEFEGDRPRRVIWAQKGTQDHRGEISFDYLVDASGRTGLMATRYLQNREYHQEFQNIGVWGYWEDTEIDQIEPKGGTASVALDDGSGWFWAIPLPNNLLSVGLVINKDVYKTQKATATLEEIYFKGMNQCPYVKEIVAPGKLISGIKVEQDYSYTASNFCGSGYFIAGDAACFLDPLLSTGVHLAMMSGTLSAACLASIIRQELTEQEAYTYYDRAVRHTYMRLLVMVSSFYHIARQQQGESGQMAMPDLENQPLPGMDDLRKAKDTLRMQVTEEMSTLLGMSASVWENIEQTTLEGDTHILAMDKLFSSLWRELFDWRLPIENGLQVLTQPRLGLVSLNENSKTEKSFNLVQV